MASLQDQLMKAGVVDAKKAKKIGKEKRKNAKQAKHSGTETEQDAVKAAAAAALKQKAEKDKAEAAERNKIAQQKEIAAQIQQLIKTNQIDIKRADISYQFVDDKKVKRIYVTNLLQKQLVNGLIAIVAFNDGYVLIPAKVAAKIAERDAAAIKLLNDPSQTEEIEEDDPYADYQIPDDLMW